jgi:hypothetical protein
MSGGACAAEQRRNEMTLLNDGEKQDFWSAITQAGYAKEDFDLTEIENKPHATGIYALSGKAVVQRKSTAVKREYSAGHATSWPAKFESDLKAGIFGAA